jgi:hypothetical protein
MLFPESKQAVAVCCNDLYIIAQHLLSSVWGALRPCYEGVHVEGKHGDGQDQALFTYVTMSTSDDALIDSLSVVLRGVGSPRSEVTQTGPVQVVASYEVRLLESGWPMVEIDGTVISAPEPALQAEAARQALGHGEKVFRTLMSMNARRQIIPLGIPGPFVITVHDLLMRHFPQSEGA